MSEDSGATPAPYILDVSVLTAITRGDYGIMTSCCTSSRSPTPMRGRAAPGQGR